MQTNKRQRLTTIKILGIRNSIIKTDLGYINPKMNHLIIKSLGEYQLIDDRFIARTAHHQFPELKEKFHAII